MRAERIVTALFCALGLAACGTTPTPAVDAPTPPTDTGEPTCGAPDLSGTGDVFGSSVGTYFDDVTIPQCDGTPYTFYNEEYCSEAHRLTVVSIAALWCVPCQEESAQLTDRITEPYRDRGVRVVQVIVDGLPQGSSFTPAQCQQWVDTYGLVNVELMDPGGALTNGRFPSGSLPSTLLVDDTGRIVFREDGASPNLVTLRAAIDAELARP